MARYTGPVCKLCRRENTKLFLKGDKCMSEKCPMNDPKVKIPGPHGDRRRKLTEYGTQLREKQKTKRYYGVMERQFANYFEMATKVKGLTTGEALLQILERRLDNVVYRLGFAMSRAEAKQLVNHGHFTVNGKKVNIPSYLVKPGDVIAVREASRSSVKFSKLTGADAPLVTTPEWMERNKEALEGKILRMPERSDIEFEVEEHLIVELYSK